MIYYADVLAVSLKILPQLYAYLSRQNWLLVMIRAENSSDRLKQLRGFSSPYPKTKNKPARPKGT
jgi:hypothetical protein